MRIFSDLITTRALPHLWGADRSQTGLYTLNESVSLLSVYNDYLELGRIAARSVQAPTLNESVSLPGLYIEDVQVVVHHRDGHHTLGVWRDGDCVGRPSFVVVVAIIARRWLLLNLS